MFPTNSCCIFKREKERGGSFFFFLKPCSLKKPSRQSDNNYRAVGGWDAEELSAYFQVTGNKGMELSVIVHISLRYRMPPKPCSSFKCSLGRWLGKPVCWKMIT